MFDTGKIPHLQPPKRAKKADFAEESLLRQIVSSFFTKKGLFCFAGVILLTYWTLCIQGERLLRQGVYDVLKKMGHDGFGISYTTSSSYLAYKSDLNLDDLVITAPEEMGGWILKAGRLSVSSNPFSPRDISLKINGTHSLTTKTIGDIRLIVGSGDVKIRLPRQDVPFFVSVSIRQVQTGSPRSMEGFFISDLGLTAEQLRPDAEKKTDKILFSLKTDEFRLPAYITAHLPSVIRSVDLAGELSGTLFDETSFLKSWMSSSGTVEIRQADIYWPPLNLSFTGTFGLNDSFDLVGAGIAQAENFFPLLDMLQNGDYLRPKRVSVAKVVLGEQAKTEQNGKLTSAFSLQSGKVYIGRILLYDRDE